MKVIRIAFVSSIPVESFPDSVIAFPKTFVFSDFNVPATKDSNIVCKILLDDDS